ncbi:hypothetical protein BB561_003479 [Smittium simulii]|uniref:HIT-type domain-containing protein n=1 Tax=Smittium simulii TaxID=133385 RepID=A0A2T9YL45_9FUNG|nr:hypothetical protein BB561_003479 [Smittium simulii]
MDDKNICSICDLSVSKYKCSSCYAPYCSVKCYKTHKNIAELKTELENPNIKQVINEILNSDNPLETLKIARNKVQDFEKFVTMLLPVLNKTWKVDILIANARDKSISSSNRKYEHRSQLALSNLGGHLHRFKKHDSTGQLNQMTQGLPGNYVKNVLSIDWSGTHPKQ